MAELAFVQDRPTRFLRPPKHALSAQEAGAPLTIRTHERRQQLIARTTSTQRRVDSLPPCPPDSATTSACPDARPPLVPTSLSPHAGAGAPAA